MKCLIINGVNLNLTGVREKGIYGVLTLEEMNKKIADFCAKNGDEVDFYQNNILSLNKINPSHQSIMWNVNNV